MSEEFQKILITGATGFIGRHLIAELSHRTISDKIRILVRNTSNKETIQSFKKLIRDLEIFTGDLTDKNSLKSAIKGCDLIINLAANVTYRFSPSLYKINAEGVNNICEAAVGEGVKKLIHVSSIAALGYSEDKNKPRTEESNFTLLNKGFHYAESKYEGDCIALRYFKEYNLPVVICLPGEVYGEYGWETARNLVDLIKCPVVWDGGTSVVYVKDVVDGLIKSAFHGRIGHKYILSGDNLTIEDIVNRILSIAGKKTKVYKIPNFILNYPIRYISLLQEKLKLKPLFDPYVIPYATKYWFVSSDKAKKELMFRPTDTDTMFKNTIEWLKEEKLI